MPSPIVNKIQSGFARQETALLWLVAIFLCTLTLVQSLVLSAEEFVNSDAAALLLISTEALRGGSLLPDWVWQGNAIYSMPTVVTFWIGLLYYVTGNAYVSYMVICGVTVLLLMLALLYAMSPLGIKPYFALSASALLLPMSQMFYYTGFVLIIIVAVGYCAHHQTDNVGVAQGVLRWILPLVAFSTGVESFRLTLLCWLPLACYYIFACVVRMTPFSDSVRKIFSVKNKIFFEPLLWLSCNILGAIYRKNKINILEYNNTLVLPFSDLPGKIWENIYGFLNLLQIHAADQPLMSLTGLQAVIKLFLFALVIYVSIYAVRTGKNILRLPLFVFGFAMLLSLSLITFTQMSLNFQSAERYLFPALSLYAICFCIAVTFYQMRNIHIGYWLLLGMLLLISLTQTLRLPLETAYQTVTNPPAVQKNRILMDYMAKHGLSKGYATYWHAYRYTAASNEKLEIAAFNFPSFTPHTWITTKRYFSAKFADSNVFAMLTNEENESVGKDPAAQAFFAQARKLDPVLDYHVYVFEHTNPFLVSAPEWSSWLSGGLSDLENWGVWTDGNRGRSVQLTLPTPLAAFKVRMKLHALEPQDVTFKAGNITKVVSVGKEPAFYSLYFALPEPVKQIKITPSVSVTPKSLKINDDGRMLGIAFWDVDIIRESAPQP